MVTAVIATFERHRLLDAARPDYLSSFEGESFAVAGAHADDGADRMFIVRHCSVLRMAATDLTILHRPDRVRNGRRGGLTARRRGAIWRVCDGLRIRAQTI